MASADPNRRASYREEPCRSALNEVKGYQYFRWSLNPYMGCAHRCTFCYVRGFEKRADRPSDDRYGRSIRVKNNVADPAGTERRSHRYAQRHACGARSRRRRRVGRTGVQPVYLKAGTREHFLGELAKEWPELVPHYERLYPRAYMTKRDSAAIRNSIVRLKQVEGIADRRHLRLEPPPEAEQTQLAI